MLLVCASAVLVVLSEALLAAFKSWNARSAHPGSTVVRWVLSLICLVPVATCLQIDFVFAVPPCSYPSLCGSDQFYCLEGSNSPSRVDPGFYATGAISIRSDQSVCEIGNYCPGNGSLYACPPGRYGGEQGLSSSMCSGSCNDGSREFVCLAT